MPYPPLSALLSSRDDSALISLLQRRDVTALGELYDCFGSVVFSLILRIVADKEVAEGLLAETFLKAWNGIGGFTEGHGALGPWILSIGRNHAIAYLRSADARSGEIISRLMPLERPSLFSDFAAADENLERLRAMRSTFTTLGDKERRILELAYFQGLTESEIAIKMEEPIGAVKATAQGAIEKLEGARAVRRE